MWTAYLETAKELFINATIVVDRFHYFSYLQDVMDKTRKKLRKSHPKQEVLKKSKWVLFKNPPELSEKEKQKLLELWAIPEFKELKQIYDLKNEFRAPYWNKRLTETKLVSYWKYGLVRQRSLPMSRWIYS
jgi:transposase